MVRPAPPSPSAASLTGMLVARPRISAKALSRPGARWVTTTKAMPLSAGIARTRLRSASSPPAEAPMPTMVMLGS